jgi:hypothetical protein
LIELEKLLSVTDPINFPRERIKAYRVCLAESLFLSALRADSILYACLISKATTTTATLPTNATVVLSLITGDLTEARQLDEPISHTRILPREFKSLDFVGTLNPLVVTLLYQHLAEKTTSILAYVCLIGVNVIRVDTL